MTPGPTPGPTPGHLDRHLGDIRRRDVPGSSNREVSKFIYKPLLCQSQDAE